MAVYFSPYCVTSFRTAPNQSVVAFGRCLLPLLLLLGGALTVSAQTKKGLKALKKEKWAEAVAAFVVDTANAELRPVAYDGLGQALGNAENPDKDYFLSASYLDQATASLKAMKAAERNELTKKYDITAGTIQKTRTAITSAAWKSIEKTGTLLQFDDFLDYFPKAPSRYKDKAEAQKAKLLAEATAKAKTYPELVLLTGRFRDEVRKKSPNTLEDLDQRVFASFLQDKGAGQLSAFFTENPQHPLKNDAARKAFPDVWQSDAPGPLLEFLAKNPSSGFVPYVRRKVTDQLKAKPMDAAQRSSLSEPARLELIELEMAASGKILDPYKRFDESEKDLWANYIRKVAPNTRAFSALEKIYKHYLIQRNWKEALGMLELGKPLFPAKQAWFDGLIPILSGPEYGIQPKSLSNVVNEEGSQYVPVPSADGKTLYFCATGREDNVGGEDVFVSMLTDSGWTRPKLVAELSGPRNQAPLSLSADGTKILLFDEGRAHQSTLQADGRWATPTPLDANLSRFAWVGLVQMSANNQTMVLEARTTASSDANLYVAQRQGDGKWGAPQPLDSLNTRESDRSPYLHPDMKTLYFSSNGHPGLGGMDVFKTTRLDDSWQRWSKPVNLGKEINTIEDDWAYKISTDGELAWFSFRRTSTDQDIMQVRLPEEARPQAVRLVELNLKDDKGLPFTGKIILENPTKGDTVGIFQANPNGETTVITVPNDKPYNIRLQQDGYFPVSMPLPVQASGKPLNIKTKLKPVRLDNMVSEGQTLKLNLLFDYDKAELKPESRGELRTVAEVAIKNGYRVNLMGYTDNAGGTDYNVGLSQKRAESARDILVEFGVKADQIKATGFGEQKPVAANNTEEGRAQNRRVEVQFVKPK